MKRTILKSIGAIVAGFILVVILSIITDLTLVKTGIMEQPFDLNTTGFILFVILYRCLFTTSGSVLTARLAPDKPMQHSMIGGAIGFVLSIIGAITMWDKPPHWYPITLIIITLPCAWLGGQIYLSKMKTK